VIILGDGFRDGVVVVVGILGELSEGLEIYCHLLMITKFLLTMYLSMILIINNILFL
jgi:hypothetical protein